MLSRLKGIPSTLSVLRTSRLVLHREQRNSLDNLHMHSHSLHLHSHYLHLHSPHLHNPHLHSPHLHKLSLQTTTLLKLLRQFRLRCFSSRTSKLSSRTSKLSSRTNRLSSKHYSSKRTMRQPMQ